MARSMAKLLAVFFLAATTARVSAAYNHTGAAEGLNIGTVHIKNLPATVRFVGRSFYNISIIPNRGCVAFGVLPDPEAVIKDFQTAQEYELLCPFFDEYSKTADAGDLYTVHYEFFDDSSSIAAAVEEDILEAGDVYLDYDPRVIWGFLVTWTNARLANQSCTAPCNFSSPRNTFQLAVAVVRSPEHDERPNYAFATFSYSKIEMATDNSKMGIVYGDKKGYLQLPFSRSTNFILANLAKKGTVIGKPGHYIYDITDIPQRIGCLDFSGTNYFDLPEPLTTSVKTADMFGGTIVRAQGHCAQEPIENNTVSCTFSERDATTGLAAIPGVARYYSRYTIICITPRTDLGQSNIVVVLEQASEAVSFSSSFYFGAQTATNADVQIVSENNYLEEDIAGNIELSWEPSVFGFAFRGGLEVNLVAYKTENNTIVSTSFPIGTVGRDENSYTVNTNQLCGASNNKCDGYLIGQFVLQLQKFDTAPIDKYFATKVAISSMPIPIGWYVKAYHRKKYGSTWYRQFCQPVKIPNIRQSCPCTRDAARLDTRLFSPAPDCLLDNNRLSKCQLQGQTKTYCYSGNPIGSQGVRCCYGQDGALIYSNDDPLSGSYILPYAPLVNYKQFGISGARTYLSYYLTHVKNFYTCCTAQGLNKVLSTQCSTFASWGQVPESCIDHKPSVFAAVGGDPHFQMPDKQTYTFNGLGEYWYVNSADEQELKIQIRLGRATSQFASAESNYTATATVVKAVALKFGDNVIQVQVQPLSYLNDPTATSKRLMILVNGEEQYWSDDQQVRFYDDFRVASSGVNQDLFHITLLNDGALVACDYTETFNGTTGPQSPGSMNCRITYSYERVQTAAGLFGKKYDDGYKLFNRTEWNWPDVTFADLTNLTSVNIYAETWKLQNVGESFFTYVGTTFEQVNDNSGYSPILQFFPEFINPDDDYFTAADTCGENDTYSILCSYDYRLTGSYLLALKTKQHFEETDTIRSLVSAPKDVCTALNLPYTLRTQLNGNQAGAEVNVTGCVQNYEPGENVAFPFTLQCLEATDGTYKWQPEEKLRAECVRSSLYDYSYAKEIGNPYVNATAADLGMSSFSAIYLGRRLTGIKVYTQLGCVVLSSTAEEGYEPMICPLAADHDSPPPVGVTDSFKFYYHTVTPDDPSGLLADIAADVKEAGQSLDASYRDSGITTAYIFTWINATFEGGCKNASLCAGQPRNSYQVAIGVTDAGKAYAILNYAKIQWSGLEKPGSTPSVFSFAGFYYGDRKGSLALPFSNTTTSKIAELVKYGTLLSLRGRYVYDVSSFPNPKRLGCYQSDVEFPRQQQLSLSESIFDIFGGNVVRLQGTCMADVRNLQCAFETKTPSGSKWTFATVHEVDPYTGVCVTPRTPSIDAGWTRLGLATNGGSIVNFVSDVYFGAQLNGGPVSQLEFEDPENKFWLSAQPNTTIKLKWYGQQAFGSPENSRVELHVVGFNANGSTYDFPTIATARMSDSGLTIPLPLPQCSQPTCRDILIGQLILKVVASDEQGVLTRTSIQRLEISTPLLPVGWYTNLYHKGLLYSDTWYQSYCDSSAGRLEVNTLPQCPCTRSSAIHEERVFFEAPDCYRPFGIGIFKENCYLSADAAKCYTTLPTANGHSIRCCYDRNDNLIHPQSSPLDGSYLLPDAVNSNYQVFNQVGANALLSFYHSHVKNMFACCSADIYGSRGVQSSCSALSYNRAASKTCAGFPYSYWTATVGDPHFVTFDGTKYTFNGIGEFWYVYSKEATFNTKIQVRITQAQDGNFTAVRAGVLSAIAIEFRGSRVEIHVQPLSFRQSGSKYLMVLINGKEQFWNNLVEEQFHENFKIVTYDNQFYVTVTAMDNGPLVYCTYYDTSALKSFGGMTCRVSIPNSYKRAINGLGGFVDDDTQNDLATREKTSPLDVQFVDASNMTAVHYTFGISWNVRRTESIFTYFDDNWELYNSKLLEIVPELRLPPPLGSISNSSINDACGNGVNRDQCQYDYVLTGISALARRTRLDLDSFDRLRADSSKLNTAACDYLDIAFANVTFSGYSVNSTAVVSACFAGYSATTKLPVTFVCRQVDDLKPTWTPTPTTLCRSDNVIVGQQIGALPVNPFNPILPNYTLPEKVIRASSITFGGRQITGFSVVAKTGCVALKANVVDASINGFPKNIADEPLLCPLFASHATTGWSSDNYTILFKQLDSKAPLLTEILLDIKTVAQDLDPLVAQAEVTAAYVFTWANARSSKSSCTDANTCNNAPRNTYEVILVVTNQLQTYAVFNYKQITWYNYSDNAGVDVEQSFGAINYGDNRGTVYLPYARTNDVKSLTNLGTIKGLAGRYIYQVTDRVQRLGCLELPSDYTKGLTQPLTLNTFVGDVYGSRRLVVQSACLPPNVDSWVCGYRKSAASPWLAATKVYRLSDYSAACSAPRLPDIDLGEWEIAVVNSTTVDSPIFYEKIYLAESIEDTTPVKLVDTLKWFSAVPSDVLRVEWLPTWFENKAILLDVSIVMYAQNSADSYKRREIRIGRASNPETAFEFSPNDFLCEGDCEGYLVGQVVLRVANSSSILDSGLRFTEIASSLVPIGWLVNKFYTAKTGKSDWYYDFCDTTPVSAPLKCPCSSTLAEADSRTFISAPSCNDIFGAECLISPSATQCFTTLPLNTDGSGLLCCYNKDKTLIYGQDEPFGGSYSLQYAPSASDSVFSITGAKAYLSYYFGHTKNLFSCCSANSSNVANSKCYEYTEARGVSKKCTDYEVSGVSGIVGDPHVLTPDNTIYSFNGVGEYWWLYVEANEDYKRPVTVQVRFQRQFKTSAASSQATIQASLLSAVAVNVGDSIIQIEVEGASYQFGSGRKLAVYVNNAEKIFFDHPINQYYAGARIESSASQDSVKVSLPFNGPSIECTYVTLIDSMQIGSMSCVTYLTPAYKLKAHGLVGRYDGNSNNDLVNRADIAAANPSVTNPDDLSAVHNFGKTWRVLETEALFNYFGTNFSEINREIDSFSPPFTLKPSTSANLTDVGLFCQTGRKYSERCEYDYRITGSRTLATHTGEKLRSVSDSQALLVVDTGFCPFLDVPNTRKQFTQSVKIGSTATIVSCVDGYVLNTAIAPPTQYRCSNTSGRVDWQPTPVAATCIVRVDTTTSSAATATSTTAAPATATSTTAAPATTTSTTAAPATTTSTTAAPATTTSTTAAPGTGTSTTAAPGTGTAPTGQAVSSTSSNQPTSPLPAEDATVEIILGVLLGVAVVAIVGLVAFYFISIAPKIAVLSSVAPAPVELAGTTAATGTAAAATPAGSTAV